MASKKVQSLKNSILEFYKLHHDKGINYTYNEWKNCELSKRTIYRLMAKFDKDGNIDRKIGSGRPLKMTVSDQKKLKKW